MAGDPTVRKERRMLDAIDAIPGNQSFVWNYKVQHKSDTIDHAMLIQTTLKSVQVIKKVNEGKKSPNNSGK